MTEQQVALTTYQDSEPLELSHDDVTFIATQLKGRVSITRELSDDRYRLSPGAYVGVVRLPSGRVVRSTPRIPTQNIFRMLAVAHALPALRLEDTVELGDLDQLLELVADYFADQLEERIEHGLYRAYVETEDNLPVVRGRIEVAEDIRRNYVLRHRTYCRFSELTWDVPENQVLRYVAHLLSAWPFGRELQARLHQLDRRMDEVSIVPFTAEDVEAFVYTRLNVSYEPIHRLSQLLLQSMSLSEEEGPFDFVSFLLDMNLLFERFVGEVFVSSVPRPFARVVLQRHAALGHRQRTDGTVRRWGVIRPDLELQRGSAVLAVLDTKYKKTSGEAIKNPDFYQVLSYCAAEATNLGGLIYPTSEFEEDDEISIRNSTIRIRRFAIDLTVPGEQLLHEARGVAAKVCAWIADGQDLAKSA